MAPPEAACIAVAGPVSENKVLMTNRSWTVDGAQVRQVEAKWPIGVKPVCERSSGMAHTTLPSPNVAHLSVRSSLKYKGRTELTFNRTLYVGEQLAAVGLISSLSNVTSLVYVLPVTIVGINAS